MEILEDLLEWSDSPFVRNDLTGGILGSYIRIVYNTFFKINLPAYDLFTSKKKTTSQTLTRIKENLKNMFF